VVPDLGEMRWRRLKFEAEDGCVAHEHEYMASELVPCLGSGWI
jgi:hypothetical protein